MTTNPDPDDETSRSRRGILAVAASAAVGGCLATTATVGGGDATGDRQTTAATETRTNTTERAQSETVTPTPTAVRTPDQTTYPVDHPNERTEAAYGPLIGDGEGGVRLVRSRAEWDRLVTDGPEGGTAEEFADYGFVERTDFDNETVVVVERQFNVDYRLRLQSVTGLGTPHVRLRIQRIGQSFQNVMQRRYVFVRLPTDGSAIRRLTAAVVRYDRRGSVTDYRDAERPQIFYYVYWDTDGGQAGDPERRRRTGGVPT